MIMSYYLVPLRLLCHVLGKWMTTLHCQNVDFWGYMIRWFCYSNVLVEGAWLCVHMLRKMLRFFCVIYLSVISRLTCDAPTLTNPLTHPDPHTHIPTEYTQDSVLLVRVSHPWPNFATPRCHSAICQPPPVTSTGICHYSELTSR